MGHLGKTVNGFSMLTIFSKHSIIDICLVSDKLLLQNLLFYICKMVPLFSRFRNLVRCLNMTMKVWFNSYSQIPYLILRLSGTCLIRTRKKYKKHWNSINTYRNTIGINRYRYFLWKSFVISALYHFWTLFFISFQNLINTSINQ